MHHFRRIVGHAGRTRLFRHTQRRAGAVVCFPDARRAAVGAADAAGGTVFGGKVRHHLPQRYLQRVQVVCLQHQQNVFL